MCIRLLRDLLIGTHNYPAGAVLDLEVPGETKKRLVAEGGAEFCEDSPKYRKAVRTPQRKAVIE